MAQAIHESERDISTMALLEDNVRAFLTERRFGVLATINRDGTPQQTVMWYDVDGDEILMNTAEGRIKASNLRQNPRISLCVEDGYRFVTLRGAVRLNDDQTQAQADIRRLALRYSDHPETIEADTAQYRQQTRITLRMTITGVVTRM